jgi:hypothetical protein
LAQINAPKGWTETNSNAVRAIRALVGSAQENKQQRCVGRDHPCGMFPEIAIEGTADRPGAEGALGRWNPEQ